MKSVVIYDGPKQLSDAMARTAGEVPIVIYPRGRDSFCIGTARIKGVIGDGENAKVLADLTFFNAVDKHAKPFWSVEYYRPDMDNGLGGQIRQIGMMQRNWVIVDADTRVEAVELSQIEPDVVID